jgi:hypothetical protein
MYWIRKSYRKLTIRSLTQRCVEFIFDQEMPNHPNPDPNTSHLAYRINWLNWIRILTWIWIRIQKTSFDTVRTLLRSLTVGIWWTLKGWRTKGASTHSWYFRPSLWTVAPMEEGTILVYCCPSTFSLTSSPPPSQTKGTVYYRQCVVVGVLNTVVL